MLERFTDEQIRQWIEGYLVGDSSPWTRARVFWTALAFVGIVSAFLLVAKLGLWD